MAAVTQRIDNYLGGVSKQPDVKKLPGQLRAADNILPDITAGMAKRPGFALEKILGSGTTYDGGKWFYIHRDDDEYYIGVLKGGAINIWNAVSGVACTVTLASGTSTYINTAKENLNVLTVQDTTIITNSAKVVTTQAAPAPSTATRATIRLLGVEYSAKYYIKIVHSATTYELDAADRTNPSGTSGADYITRNADSSLGAADPPKQILSAEELLTDFKAAIDGWGITGMTVTRLPESLEIYCPTAFTIEVTGGQANDAMEVFTGQVFTLADLPEQSVHGRMVLIQNSASAAEDGYWAEYVADNGVSGVGYWEESRDPTVSAGLDAASMPHELVNTALNTFVFQEIAWEDRLVGDDLTNTHPSFVGSTITQPFFYNNRLGFLTGDNVSMSQAGEYYNFYFISALTATAADPVDISAASVRPAKLHAVIPNAQGLIIFSQYQQFLMFSTEGNITSSNVQIRGISNLENDFNIDPVEMKEAIIFASKSANYTQVFAMKTLGESEQPQIVDIGRIVNRFIPASVDSLVSSSSNSMFAFYGQSSREVFLFRSFDDGEEPIFQAWFKWVLPGNVQFMVIDEDTVFAVTKQVDSTEFTLISASLADDPSSNIMVRSDGVQVNPSMDIYAVASSVVYDAPGNFSKAYIPFGDDTATLNPVVLVVGDATMGDEDVGLYVTPDVATDGGGTYFKIDSRDLSGVASDVLVGYTYDMTLELPTTYYRLEGETTDYTASLILSRYKFSVSNTGAVEFRTRPTGESEWSTVIPVVQADYALANDLPVVDARVMTIPIHQRNTNFEFSVFSDTPFPVGVSSMMWEGQYSPRFYTRS